ncbi:MAG TPA: glycosyltransferase [Candidatus Binataceae bacterium]|nr:glycosyltransferase [Candidatus Binataceae bacterium]
MIRASIVIPVYNGERTIARALDSAMAQRCDGECEVIVVDDGSSDATPQILETYGARLRVLTQENRGPAAARNAGAALARGEYLAFLDADDAFLPNKMAVTVPVLDRVPAAVLVFHDAIPVDASGRETARSYVTPAMAWAPTMADLLERWWPILPSTAVMRRKTFEACGGFVEEFRSAAYEDPYLFLLAREHGEFQYVPERLTYYTIEPPAIRMEKYVRAQEVFIRRVRERYGASARGLIRNTRHAYASALGYQGLLAMCAGEVEAARGYFVRALRHQPNLRTALRLMRTYLPARIARALSGRTAQGPNLTA